MARRAASEGPAQQQRTEPELKVEYPDLEADHTDASSKFSVASSAAPKTPRKRRNRARSNVSTSTKSSNVSTSTKSSTKPPPPAPRASTGLDPTADAVVDSITCVGGLLFSIVSFVGGTIRTMLRLVHTPLMVFMALYLVAAVAAYGYQALSVPITRALMPLCNLPGVSLLDIPACSYPGYGRGGRNSKNPNFKDLMKLQANFEDILEKSASGSGLAYDLKKTEFAISDLNTLVRASSLGCRDELSNRLEEFIRNAKTTSKDLSRFGSSVNGVVDSIISIDNYAIRTIAHARSLQIDATAQNPIVALVMAPFRHTASLAEVEASVMVTFIAASTMMDNNLQNLILRAKSVLDNLETLDEKLKVIHEVITREDNNINDAYDDVLGRLWTKLGGNSRRLDRFRAQLRLLQDLTNYRSQAAAHLRVTLIRLVKMQADLEDLRTHVAEPGVLTDAGVGTHPLEVHMETIRRGVKRLSDGMERARLNVAGHRERVLGGYEQVVIGLGDREEVGAGARGGVRREELDAGGT